MEKLEKDSSGSNPLPRKSRWSLTLETERPPEKSTSGRWRFWLQLIIAILGIAATLAVGAGLLL